MASTPFSLRMPERLLAHLRRHAEMRGEPPSRAAVRLIDEGLAIEAYPGIFFQDGPAGRRPTLASGPDVWQVIDAVKSFGTGEEAIAEAAEWLSLGHWQVRTAIRYYADHREEIDTWIRRNDELAVEAEDRWRREQASLA